MNNRRLIISFPMDDTIVISPPLINICMHTHIPFSLTRSESGEGTREFCMKLLGLPRRDKVTLEVKLLKITNL